MYVYTVQPLKSEMQMHRPISDFGEFSDFGGIFYFNYF